MGAIPTVDELEALTPHELVNKLWDKRIRNDVIRALLGGLTAGELRRVQPSPLVRDALREGLQHRSPPVRWWCLQLIDHVADASLLQHAVPLLDDPIPRVRRMALHALTCERCKTNPEAVEAGRRLLPSPR